MPFVEHSTEGKKISILAFALALGPTAAHGGTDAGFIGVLEGPARAVARISRQELLDSLGAGCRDQSE